MASLLDPPIALKVRKMRDRVRWQCPQATQQGIDQTALALQDGGSSDQGFSFLVIGDSGSGPHPDHHPQRQVAEHMVPHLPDCRFLLHTGDVVYQVGSSEQYLENFIRPYREWLVGGERPEAIAYHDMVFRFPFLAVPGNHDYYNLPRLYGALMQLAKPLRQLLRVKLRPNVGWHGSNVGDAYSRAFLDYLAAVPPDRLAAHFQRHYTSPTSHGRALTYRSGDFTRLPNRYYTFRYGGIDFFALDSSTFNAPSPLPNNASGDHLRQTLDARRAAVARQRQAVLTEAVHLRTTDPHAHERLDDLQAKLEQLDEQDLDIEKQLTATVVDVVDVEQLLWLRQRLIDSWRDPQVRGRVLYFHHPGYVSEATKWQQGQTLAVRHHLRWVLDEVKTALDLDPQQRPVVDLILNGHAHCFEYLKTQDTGHGDAHIDCLVCGGSGLSLRRQREEGSDLHEDFGGESRLVAKSQLYVGLTGHKEERRRPYSFVRIDVQPGERPRFVVTPHISERYHQQWQDYALSPLVLG